MELTLKVYVLLTKSFIDYIDDLIVHQKVMAFPITHEFCVSDTFS